MYISYRTIRYGTSAKGKLADIGFTMSLLISGLAFRNPSFIEQAKYGILIASVIAGI